MIIVGIVWEVKVIVIVDRREGINERFVKQVFVPTITSTSRLSDLDVNRVRLCMRHRVLNVDAYDPGSGRRHKRKTGATGSLRHTMDQPPEW